MPYYSYPMYQAPAPDQLSQLRQAYQPAPPQQQGILWVQGEEAAKAYMVAPGATVLLMDSDHVVLSALTPEMVSDRLSGREGTAAVEEGAQAE